MKIALHKFGTTLVSRPAGKEAFLAFQPVLREVPESETVEIDFEGVAVLTPSWADEFITPLAEQYRGRFVLGPSSNPSVLATLQTLEKAKVAQKSM